MPKHLREDSSIGSERDLASLGADEARELLVQSLRLNPSGGQLEWYGSRYVLMRPEVLVNLQKQMEQTVGASTKGILYLAGERSGRDGIHEIKKLLEGFPLEDGPLRDSTRRTDTSSFAGWGRYEVRSVDLEESRGVIVLENSAVAELYGPSKRPVCHLLAGWIAGIATHLSGKEVLCEEIACKAQGRERCEFELRPMPTL